MAPKEVVGDPAAKIEPGSEGTADQAFSAAVAQERWGRALTLLMERHGDEIFRLCAAMVGSATLAADVHQTVFVQVYRDLPKFQGASAPKTWLYAIARHRCLDALRARRRFRRRFDTRSELPDRPEAPILEEVLDRRVRVAALQSALAELSPKVRIAVVLRYLDGMAYAEIGEICGAKPATIQARVARALPVLRAHLARAGFGPEEFR